MSGSSKTQTSLPSNVVEIAPQGLKSVEKYSVAIFNVWILLEPLTYSAILMVGELRGHGLAVLAYEIKTYENLFSGLLARYMKICTKCQRKFPTIQYDVITCNVHFCRYSSLQL